MPFPIFQDGNCVLKKSFYRKENDPFTGTCKCITWVCTGKEKSGTLSYIVALKNGSHVEFRKVLYLVRGNLQQEGLAVHDGCAYVQFYFTQVQDKESGLWYVCSSRFVEKMLPVSFIFKPLVTARDEDNSNTLWILSFKKQKPKQPDCLAEWVITNYYQQLYIIRGVGLCKP